MAHDRQAPAAEEAEARSLAGTLLRVVSALPACSGPALLRWAGAAGPRSGAWSAWAEPSADRWRVGLGLALELEAAGPERLGWLDAWCSALTERSEGVPAAADLPLAWLGMRFDARRRGGAGALAWGRWPNAALFVPERVLALDGGSLRSLAQAWVPHGVPLDPIRERLHALAAAPLCELARARSPQRGAQRSLGGGASQSDWIRLAEDARARCADPLDPLRKLVLARGERFVRPEALTEVGSALVELCERFPGAQVFAQGRDEETFLGATPERLLRLRGRELDTQALAGTALQRPGAAAALSGCPKTAHEHRVVVEGLRAALGPLCTSMSAPERPAVRATGALLHLETPVQATLNKGVSALDVVDALHPTPALGGDPAGLAQDWLRRHEGFARGWFGAPLGTICANGDADVAVAIRSALVRRDEVWAFAGAGIVDASDPRAEWEETALKLQPMIQALGLTRPVPQSAQQTADPLALAGAEGVAR